MTEPKVGKTYFIDGASFESDCFLAPSLKEGFENYDICEGDEYYFYEVTLVKRHKVERKSEIVTSVVEPLPKTVAKKATKKK